MYGQMMVGLWIYIGMQGIVQGIYEIFVEVGCQYYNGDLKGKWVLIGGFGGMGGVQFLVVVMVGVCCLVVECDEICVDFCLCICYVDEKMYSFDEVLVMIECWIKVGEVKFVVLIGNVVEVFLDILCCMNDGGLCFDIVIDQISVYDLVYGYLFEGWIVVEWCMCQQIEFKVVVVVVKKLMCKQVEVMVVFSDVGILIVDYGNNICQMVLEEGFECVFVFLGFVFVYIWLLFCCGIGLFCWVVLLGDLEDILKIDVKMKELFFDNYYLYNWLDMVQECIVFQGLLVWIMWIGLGDWYCVGFVINEMVCNGELKVLVVIGCDYLDSGSVVLFNWEIEVMQDGLDVVFDWLLLNVFLNIVLGVIWVLLYYGGGVGMGFLQYFGMVICCDGFEDVDCCIVCVLWNDFVIGVMCYVDVGYDIVLDCVCEYGLNLFGIL